jgi:hypothetical protein
VVLPGLYQPEGATPGAAVPCWRIEGPGEDEDPTQPAMRRSKGSFS